MNNLKKKTIQIGDTVRWQSEKTDHYGPAYAPYLEGVIVDRWADTLTINCQKFRGEIQLEVNEVMPLMGETSKPAKPDETQAQRIARLEAENATLSQRVDELAEERDNLYTQIDQLNETLSAGL